MPGGEPWTDDELTILREHPELSASEMTKLLPRRSVPAIGNMRMRRCPQPKARAGAQPLVREPGDYVEVLAHHLTDDFECMEIWLRWNGYTSYRELGRHMGWVTLLCVAK